MNFGIELLNDIPYENLILGCGSDDERVGARLGNNRAKRGLRRSKAQRLLEALLEVCIAAGLAASSLGRIRSEHVLHDGSKIIGCGELQFVHLRLERLRP